MIVVRNVFQVKFAKMKDAVALWKEGHSLAKKSGGVRDIRILTDVTGPAYTLAVELTYESLADYERDGRALMSTPEWASWYQKVVPLMESSRREIYTIVG